MVTPRWIRILAIAGAALAALLPGPGSAEPFAQSAGNVFQQSSAADGLVVMEAESFRTNTPNGGHTWLLVTDPAGYIGPGAMQADPNSGSGGSPRLDFRVLFVKTGVHTVWIRGRALTTPAIGNNDSVHVGLDGALPASCDKVSGWGDGWTWRTNTMDNAPATFTIDAIGVHTVSLVMREDGFIADRILITSNAGYTGVTAGGTMNGPAESPQVVDQSPGAPGTLSAAAGVGQVSLSWGPATNAQTYTVQRATAAGGPWTTLAAGVTGTTYLDRNFGADLDTGVTYYYRVLGVHATFGAGPPSNVVSAKPLPIPPRTEGSEEGLADGKCACNTVAARPPLESWLVLALISGLLLLRRRI